jgi:hypothetical protein
MSNTTFAKRINVRNMAGTSELIGSAPARRLHMQQYVEEASRSQVVRETRKNGATWFATIRTAPETQRLHSLIWVLSSPLRKNIPASHPTQITHISPTSRPT